jgi:hypothetical protein
MDKGACIVREINLEGKPFFAWFLPHNPHDAGAPPDGIAHCYDTVGAQTMERAGGGNEELPSGNELGRMSWLDCATASFLDFLETTPDTRFCDLTGPHAPQVHAGCGPCARPCNEAAPPGTPDHNPCCDNGDPTCTAACVNGRCDSDIPCLIDTTVVLFINDNGQAIRNSKGQFAENGFRNPIILSYGQLGNFPRRCLSATHGMPEIVQPELHNDTPAHALDIISTILDYAGMTDVCAGSDRCVRHRGASLRKLAQNPTAVPWRKHLFGHKNPGSDNIRGGTPHFVRTRRVLVEPDMLPSMAEGRVDGPGWCDSNQDCALQKWDQLGLGICVNGICTTPCTDTQPQPCAQSLGALAEIFGSNINLANVRCIHGFCAVTNACKVEHSTNSVKVYNLANDPDEERNLLGSQSNRDQADPLRACYDDAPDPDEEPTPGRKLFDTLNCELVRWCLEGCRSDGTGTLDCSSCKWAECEDCDPTEIKDDACNLCAAQGTCYKVVDDPPRCRDCRRRCDENGEANDAKCADLGVPCLLPDKKCAACSSGSCPTTTTTVPMTTTTTLPACGSTVFPSCNGSCPAGSVCSLDVVAAACVCVPSPPPGAQVCAEGCNSALSVCSAGVCPPGLKCQSLFGCGCWF